MPKDTDKFTYLVMPLDEALNKISGHIGTGKKLLESPVSTPEELADVKDQYRAWRDYGIQLLTNVFSDGSMANRLSNSGVVYSGPDFKEKYRHFRLDFSQDIATLVSIEGTLPIMPTKPRNSKTKNKDQHTSPRVTQNFHGSVGNVTGINSGRLSQTNTTSTQSSDGGKLWQLFLAILGIAGVIAAAYIAYKMHWV